MTTSHDTNPATGLIHNVVRHDVVNPTATAPSDGVDRTSASWRKAYEDALRGPAPKPAPAPVPAPKVDAPFSVQTVADGVFAKSWKQVNDESEEAEVDLSADLFRSSFSSTVHERAAFK